MLRFVLLALLLANAGMLAWTQGWLASYDLAPAAQAEPQRLEQQLRPEAMRLLSPAEARQLEGNPPPVATAAGAAAECLQAGLFTDEQAGLLRTRLQAALPAKSWSLEPGTESGRWIIYMGRYNSPEMLSVKRSELRRLGVSFEPLTDPAFGPGLLLGQFNSQTEADNELVRLTQRGVRSGKVALERPDSRGQRLTLPLVDAALKTQLDGLKPQLAGKALVACRS